MTDSLLSPSWYRVSGLRPRLRGHARFYRHLYRGQSWHVLQDRATGRSHLLSPSAHRIAGLMDGRRTVHEIWELAHTQLGDDAPTQDEMIHLLGTIHGADLILCDVTPDVDELFRRTRRRERRPWWQRAGQLLAVRLPLADPDRFLARWSPRVAPVFTRGGAALAAVVVAAALVQGAVHADELAAAGPSALLDPRGLLLVWLWYPLVKALHELGHAFANRIWGGEVHELGLLLLVFVPVPYVDASSAWAFPEKSRRIAVGAAGIAVELTLAAVALLVWLAVEPGLVRDCAHAVFWIGGLSTLLFNGNPLLRFDGYYVLADAIEIPNLYGRSREYLAGLVQRRLFGMSNVRDPVSAPGEARWFLCYGIASSVYRFAVVFGIALYLAQRFFVFGVLLALAAVASGVLVPLAQQVAFVLTSPRLGAQRPRALALSAGLAAAVAVLVFALPLPEYTVAQGVVWPPEHAQLRSRSDGFVEQLLADAGSAVQPGQPILVVRDPQVEADVAVLAARLRELRTRRQAALRSDRARARILGDQIASAESALTRARQRAQETVVRSPGSGRLVLQRPGDLIGRYVTQGDALGWVLGDALETVRVVVPQSEAVRVRQETRAVEVRLASGVARVLPAHVQREVPGASQRLPTPALGTGGGGPFAVEADDESGLTARETVFQFDIGLQDRVELGEIGTRAFVRFDHGRGSLAGRIDRSLRRLFLRHLGA